MSIAFRALARSSATRASSFAPRLLAARSLHATGARFADEAAAAGGLTLNFALPSKSLYTEAAVEMVILPGGDGMFGVMANHVPTITELKPGVVSVQEAAGGPLTKYFVSGGFASVNSDSILNLTALEAVTIDELDPEAVKLGLAQYSAAYASATEDYEKSEAEIGVEVYQAMSYAISEP
jgi:F-type H+-transporting ATPase subunit delta